MEYIFPLPWNVFHREGTGVKTDFFPQENFTFRSRREEGRLSNSPEQLSTRARVDTAGKLDSSSDRRSRKGKHSQGKDTGLIV